MVKSYAAFTSEVDDIDLAVSEILTQLEPEKNCLKSTVAVVTCYYEFVTAGIVTALYDKLKFPIIGTTTTALSTNNGVGQLCLSLLMLTSDDVTFTASCSDPLKDDLMVPFEDMYQKALEGHSEKPKLILSAAPLMLNFAGDHFVAALNKVSGGVPNFGTLAIDDTQDYSNSYAVFNETVSKDIYGIIVASGNISPKFLYASFSPQFILNGSAIITKSDGNLVQEVDNKPLINYMEYLGLAVDGHVTEVLHSIPFVLDYAGEDIPISRVLLSWSDDGYGICGGLMPEGTRFKIGTWDKDDVINTTVRTVGEMLADEAINTLLLYTCQARSYALGTDILAEVKKVNEVISDRLVYFFAYSGGEICPVRNAFDANNFHNNTIIACGF